MFWIICQRHPDVKQILFRSLWVHIILKSSSLMSKTHSMKAAFSVCLITCYRRCKRIRNLISLKPKPFSSTQNLFLCSSAKQRTFFLTPFNWHFPISIKSQRFFSLLKNFDMFTHLHLWIPFQSKLLETVTSNYFSNLLMSL